MIGDRGIWIWDWDWDWEFGIWDLGFGIAVRKQAGLALLWLWLHGMAWQGKGVACVRVCMCESLGSNPSSGVRYVQYLMHACMYVCMYLTFGK